jgi:hypothetical protein
LIHCVERQREKKDELHVGIDPANVQRPTSNVRRSMQNAARLKVER